MEINDLPGNDESIRVETDGSGSENPNDPKLSDVKKEEDLMNGCFVPFMLFVGVIFALLYPIVWTPFAFTRMGFPIDSLYVWPPCVLVWILLSVFTYRHVGKNAFIWYMLISSWTCLTIETFLTFHFALPPL